MYFGQPGWFSLPFQSKVVYLTILFHNGTTEYRKLELIMSDTFYFFHNKFGVFVTRWYE